MQLEMSSGNAGRVDFFSLQNWKHGVKDGRKGSNEHLRLVFSWQAALSCQQDLRRGMAVQLGVGIGE